MTIGQLIKAEKPSILAEWEQKARQSLASAAGLNHPALIDHLPQLLDVLADASVQAASGEPLELPEDVPVTHVLHRLEEGYDLSQVTTEYALLRRVLMSRLATSGNVPLHQVLLLNRVIDQAVAYAVERYRQARQRTLTSLDQITERALGAAEADAFLTELLGVMVDAVPAADSASILVRNDHTLEVRAASGHLRDALGYQVNIGEGVVGEVAATGRPLLLHDAAQDPRIRSMPIRETHLQTLYCIPMLTEGQVMGVAIVASATASEFTPEDLVLMRVMVARATVHLTRAELIARERRALVDAETQHRQLSEREALLRTVVDGVKDYSIFLVTVDGRVGSWNPGGTRIKGYLPEEAIGMPFENFFTAADRAAGLPRREMEIAAARGVYEGEGQRVRKDGSTFDADVALWAVREGGELKGFVKFTRDISDRKQHDREREELLARARAAVTARDEFISIAAHDLRSPLASLCLQLQMVLRKAKAPAAPPRSWAIAKLEAMEHQVKRITQLLDNLLDVSRLADGRLHIAWEELDLAALVREVAARFDDAFEAAGCTLTLRADGPLVGLWDRLRLDQIVTNLLSNVAKYARGYPVEVWVEGNDRTAVLGVRDHGPGIAPEEQERVFGKFQRAGDATAEQGNGLGLWIVRNIVEAMGGTVRLESVRNAGSTFLVELPRTPQPGVA